MIIKTASGDILTSGVTETEDVQKALIFLVKGLTAARKNDGSINLYEVVSLVAQSLPLMIEAYKGYDRIPTEIKEAGPEEYQKLAVMGIELTKAVAELFLMGTTYLKPAEGVV